MRSVQRHGLRFADNWMESKFRGLTQTELAAEMGVSRPTVSNLVRRAKRLLVKDGDGVALDPMRCGVALGIDFGQGVHRIGIADVHAQLHPHTDSRDGDNHPAAASFEWAKTKIPAILERTGHAADALCAVGVSFPGQVAKNARTLLVSPGEMDMSWEAADVHTGLLSGLNLPAPWVDSDYNASALTEHLWGALADETDALYVKASRRCACTLLVDHLIYRGSEGISGRLGRALVRGTTEWKHIDEIFSIEALMPSRDEISASELVKVARADDAPGGLLDRLKDAAWSLGFTLAPVIDAVNPAVIVIGGSLGVAAFPWVTSELVSGITMLGDSPARADVSKRLRPATFDSRTALRGVIAGALLRHGPSRLAAAMDPT